jgi:hypothetical protein
LRTGGWLVAGIAAALVLGAGALLLTSSDATFSTGEEGPSAADEAVARKAALATGAPKKVEAVVALPYRIEGKVVERGQAVSGVRVTARRTGAAWDASDPASWVQHSPLKQFRDALERLDAPSAEPPDVDVETTNSADRTFSLSPKQKGM